MSDTSLNPPGFLAALDTETQQEAEAELMACCASRRWAAEMAARRPYHDLQTLRRVSDAALDALDWPDVLEALAAHPRIGERHGGAGTEGGEGDTSGAHPARPGAGVPQGPGAGVPQGREAGWSRAEQAAAATDDERTAAELAAGNAEYERRFGHVFLICATGRSADEVLAALRKRLGNDEVTERRVVREELRKIVDLRLARLVGEAGGRVSTA